MKTYGEFFRDETGAITIDWVALTAGILLLGIMVVYAIFNGGVAALVGEINENLTSATSEVDVGIAPALYDMELASGDKLPAGSEVTGVEALTATDPVTGEEFTTGVIETTFTLPDGSTVTTTELNLASNTVSDPTGVGVGESGGLPMGTTVNSGNSLTLPEGGGTITQSSVSCEFDCA